jgi:hypothetical protein
MCFFIFVGKALFLMFDQCLFLFKNKILKTISYVFFNKIEIKLKMTAGGIKKVC